MLGHFMKLKIIPSLLLAALPLTLYSAESLYCPQNGGTVMLGMNMDQVLAACGKPASMQDSQEPIYRKVPVRQLVYNNQGTDTAFYGPWTIPTRETGSQLEVDVIDNKVKAVRVNGGDLNAFTLCDEVPIQIDDPVGKVYSACGSPSLVNDTFINMPIPSESKPQIWIYQVTPYQPAIVLTFIDGKLQSIN